MDAEVCGSWKAKKKEDGTWDLRSFKIVLGIDMTDKAN